MTPATVISHASVVYAALHKPQIGAQGFTQCPNQSVGSHTPAITLCADTMHISRCIPGYLICLCMWGPWHRVDVHRE